jgi:hypothetical protein
MRFSSALSFKSSQTGLDEPSEADAAERAEASAPAAAVPAQEPPDDLDERVRRIGEWQLGEA